MEHGVNQSERDVAAQVRSALIDKISSERYDLWIANSTQLHFSESTLTLTFDSDLRRQVAERMLKHDLVDVLGKVAGASATIAFRVERIASAPASDDRQPCNKRSGRSAGAQERMAATTGLPKPKPVKQQRGPDVALQTDTVSMQSQFVRGDSNQLAWATANLVVSDPGRLTPVLLHGPTGCGKSLLADAIAQQLRVTRRMRRVVHMTSEQFTNDFTDSLRGGGMPMFRRKYRDVEALVLEDIHFFIGKRSTLTEVKHTLDNLLRLGKQVVLTANRPPNELQQLGSDLTARIRGGLTSPLFPLNEQVRYEVLKRELATAGVSVSDAIVSGIAERVAGDGRVLSGIAKRLTAVNALKTEELDWDGCWSAICDLVHATQPIIKIADIERVVCTIFGLEPDSLQSETKSRRVSQPRMLAMFLARKYTPAAYKEIGHHFGRRRHSTVISAEKTVACWLDENSSLGVGKGLTVRDAIRHVESQLQVG